LDAAQELEQNNLDGNVFLLTNNKTQKQTGKHRKNNELLTKP